MISMNCVVVGDAMVGKTSLLSRQSANTFTREYTATVFIDHFHCLSTTYKNVQVELDLWDTAGQEGKEGLRPLSKLEVDVCLMCFSIMCPDSFENISWKWHEQVHDLYPNAALILVGTMQDLFKSKTELAKLKAVDKMPKTYENGTDLAKKIGAFRYCECSALTGHGVVTVFDEAIHAVLEKKNIETLGKDCVVM